MSFRSRLVLAVIVLTVMTLGAAFVAVSVANNKAQERRLDAALLAEARLDAAAATSLEGEELTISEKPLPAANDLGPLTKYGAIYSASGALRARTASLGAAAPPLASVAHPGDEPFDFWHAGEHLRGVLVPIPGEPGATLLLAAARAELDGDAAFLRRAMAIAFAVAVSWTAIVATGVMRRLTRDHQEIAEVARRVAGGDLSARVRPRSKDDELAQLGRNIDEMIARLEILVESQRRFVAHAAHELRLPLTTVYGELSHALRRSRSADEYRAAIEEALDSTRGLKLLADDLLTLARAGSEPARTGAAVPISDVVRAAVARVEPYARERAVTLEAAHDRAVVLGNARDLERMVQNLLDNAVRHSPRGGRVAVSASESGGLVRVAITDRGPGVPPDERDKIFEAFYRGRHGDDADSSGSGLGLAIVRQIARAHGGEVRLAERAAEGACFEVVLPAAGEAPRESEPSPLRELAGERRQA